MSFVGAARRLGSHENTIKYRVRRCEDLLGRSVRESPLALASALMLADSLGPGDAQGADFVGIGQRRPVGSSSLTTSACVKLGHSLSSSNNPNEERA